MPIAPGQAISNSRVFWAAGGSGGGGGDSGPPTVIAPFPGIGAEGTYYAQQVRTTGATPQTFEVSSGDLPNGFSLGETTGFITGTCPVPYGGLYEGTITITNDVGTVDYPFSILVTGTAPVWGTDYLYPLSQLGTGFAGSTYDPAFIAAYSGDFTAATTTGAIASGSVPMTWSFISTQTPSLPTGVTWSSVDGLLHGQPTDPSQLCTLFQFGVKLENYFGSQTINFTYIVCPTLYWGEWHGALPGAFTAANIQTDLFDDATPGPRVIPGYNGSTTNVAMVGAIACNASGVNFLRYPAVSPARARVLAVPKLWFTGDVNGGVPAWSTYATFTPAFPTPYQENLALTVNGISVLYDIYVLTSTAAQIDLFFFPA